MARKSAHERYQEKQFTGSSHSWATEICRNLPAETSVLDIGAGSGVLGRTLQDAGIEDVYAIEIDPKTVELIRPLYKAVVSDLEALQGKQFDVILMLDILEHLPQPFKYLQEVNKHLKPGGRMLISIPNIAHWSMRLSLLFGFFEYTERGHLDKTHLQFFNRRRFLKLSRSLPGVELISLDYSISPAEFVLPAWLTRLEIFELGRKFRLFFTRLWPTLGAYQNLGVLRKKTCD